MSGLPRRDVLIRSLHTKETEETLSTIGDAGDALLNWLASEFAHHRYWVVAAWEPLDSNGDTEGPATAWVVRAAQLRVR